MRKKAPKKKVAKKKAARKQAQEALTDATERYGLTAAATPADVEARQRLMRESPELCKRMVRHDSIKWTCACGASGPVGRSADGIPYVNAAMLEHATGETKIKIA